MRAVPDIPARLHGGNAQQVQVSGLDYTLHLDIAKLPESEAGLATGKWTVVWDELTNTYRRVEFTNLPAAPVIGGFVGGLANISNSRDEAELTEFDAEVKLVQLLGASTPGDAGPPMPCIRTNGPVTNHDGWFRSADRFTLSGASDPDSGGYWEYRSRNQPIWIEWFGGKGDYYIVAQEPPFIANQVNPTPTDNHAAFHSAVKFLYSRIQYVGTPEQLEGVPLFSGGPAIQLGYNAYYSSDDWIPDRGITLAGMGGSYHDGPRTQVIFPAGKRGVVVNSSASFIPGANDLILQDIFFRSLGHAGFTDKHGLTMKIATIVERCGFHNFGGDGINIVNHTGTSNANFFYLNRCVIYDCAGHGVLCLGAESNGGSGYSLSVRHNGGWGIMDDSYLGSFFYGCLEEYNEGGPYFSRGINGRGVFIGCYNEGYHTPSYVGPNSHSIGGMRASGTTVAEGGSAWIYNDLYSHRLAYGGSDIGDKLGIAVRYRPNFIQSYWVDGEGFGNHWCVEPTWGVFTWRYGDSPDLKRIAYAITTAQYLQSFGRSEPVDAANIVFPRGFWYGAQGSVGLEQQRYLGLVDHYGWQFAYPGSDRKPGSYASGDILINVGAGQNFYDNHFASMNIQTGVYTPTVWTSGGDYTTDWYVKNSAGKFYRCEVDPGAVPSTVEPVHASGVVTGADGYGWRHLSDLPARFRRFGPLMGDVTVTVNDPIFNLYQTWNNAAVVFVGHTTNITDTASHADSFLEEWKVNGVQKAAIKKDGTFLSNGVPVLFDALLARIEALEGAAAARTPTRKKATKVPAKTSKAKRAKSGLKPRARK
jgi:hypothetical protein